MTGRHSRQLAHGQRGDDERREHEQDRGCGREIGVPAAEGDTHRPDADREVAPVLDQVEGPVEGGEEDEIEELDQEEDAEQRSDEPRHEAPGTGRQGDGEADHDEPFEREPHEGARGEKPGPDRSDENGPDDGQGKQREHGRFGRAPGTGRSGLG